MDAKVSSVVDNEVPAIVRADPIRLRSVLVEVWSAVLHHATEGRLTFRVGRDMKDDEFLFFNEKDTYTIFGVDAAYTWRVDTKLRPYAKFGLAHADFEAALPSLPTLSDDGIGLSVGGGLEVGSHRFAFFLDLDFVEVELRLGQIEDDLSFADATLGFIYRF